MQEQSEDLAAAQASLAAAVGKLFDDAMQEWQRRARRNQLLEGLQACGAQNAAEPAQVEAQGESTSSLILHQEGLSAFLEDARIPTISRYVSFGSGGPAGANAAGRLLSILATAHLAGLNVYRYLLDWLDACARNEEQGHPGLRRLPPPQAGGD